MPTVKIFILFFFSSRYYDTFFSHLSKCKIWFYSSLIVFLLNISVFADIACKTNKLIFLACRHFPVTRDQCLNSVLSKGSISTLSRKSKQQKNGRHHIFCFTWKLQRPMIVSYNA